MTEEANAAEAPPAEAPPAEAPPAEEAKQEEPAAAEAPQEQKKEYKCPELPKGVKHTIYSFLTLKEVAIIIMKLGKKERLILEEPCAIAR